MPDFDVAIIGSSPLLIIYALQARRAGKSVAILNREPGLGGAWSLDWHDIGSHKVLHETACHLIEWYEGGYSLLADLSGVPFEICDPQPVKVWHDGRVEPYTTKPGIAFEYLRAIRSVGYGLAKVALSLAGIRYSRSTALYQLRHSIDRLRFESRYRLSGIANYEGVRAPRGGFASFIETLSEQVVRSGITVIVGRATEILPIADGQSSIRLEDKRAIIAREVVVGESCEIASLGEVPHPPNRRSAYHHVLVSLPAQDTQLRNSYVHFPDHPLFHRITFVGDVTDTAEGDIAIFLLQLRTPLAPDFDIAGELDKVFQCYRIARSILGLRVLKSIDATYVSSSFDSGWRFQGTTPLLALRTIGDLSRNALINRAVLSPKI